MFLLLTLSLTVIILPQVSHDEDLVFDDLDISSSKTKSLPKEITKEKRVAIIGDHDEGLPKLRQKKQVPVDDSDYIDGSGDGDEGSGDAEGDVKGTFKSF